MSKIFPNSEAVELLGVVLLIKLSDQYYWYCSYHRFHNPCMTHFKIPFINYYNLLHMKFYHTPMHAKLSGTLVCKQRRYQHQVLVLPLLLGLLVPWYYTPRSPDGNQDQLALGDQAEFREDRLYLFYAPK